MNDPRRHFVKRTACPCCNCPDFNLVYQCPFVQDPIRKYLHEFYAEHGGVDFTYLEGVDFVLHECRRCSLVYQAWIGDELLMRMLYEQWINPVFAKQRDDLRRNLTGYMRYAREIISVLAHLGTHPKDTRVFDFGMGWGKWCAMAKGFGCQAYGSELSAERIAHARSQGVNVIAWDEIPGGRFDFINTEQVFEHLPEPLGTLEHLVRGLRPGGMIKLATPNGDRIRELLRRPDWTKPKGHPESLNPVAPLEHINCFSPRAMRELGRKAGLLPVNLEWNTSVEITSNKPGLAGLRSRAGRVSRALSGLFGVSSTRRSGTYQFFRKP